MRSSARSPVSEGRRRDPGDVADPEHRRALVEAAGEQIDLLVNNAGPLGPSPQPALAVYPLSELARVYQVNVFASGACPGSSAEVGA
jgi:NAD(P)-dependent dehydrogenase (short-subunit alcohol dehydrogenase family)